MHSMLRKYFQDILSGVYYESYKTDAERLGRISEVVDMSDDDLRALIVSLYEDTL